MEAITDKRACLCHERDCIKIVLFSLIIGNKLISRLFFGYLQVDVNFFINHGVCLLIYVIKILRLKGPARQASRTLNLEPIARCVA